MAKYQKVVNIWDPSVNPQSLQVGQVVEAGAGGNRGMWCGQRDGRGSLVVMFFQNAKNYGDFKGYRRNLLNYAKGC